MTDAEEVVRFADRAERVVVLTRQGCQLQRRYTDQVPVTFVDGAQHDFWRVDPTRLRAALLRTR